MRTVPLFVLAALGCKEEPPVCDASIVLTAPVDGAGPVARDTELVLEFEGNLPYDFEGFAPTFSLSTEHGSVDGSFSVEDNTIRFTPDELLPADTEVDWSADVCGESVAGSFTTGALESGVAQEDVAGSSYAIDLADATWISPEGGEELVSMAFGGAFLIGVENVSSTEIDCIGAAGEATDGGSWQQDPCYNTVDFEPMPFNNPYFLLQSDAIEFTVADQPAILHSVSISGGLTADGIVDGAFSGEADIRDYDGFDCDMLELYAGISCVECKSDGEVKCIWLEAVDVEGDLVDGVTVVPNEDPAECG